MLNNPITTVTQDVNGKADIASSSFDLRVYFLNSAVCDNKNFALMDVTADPAGSLHDLATELKTAEDDGKVVWIVGNIAPGSPSCNSKWSARYNAIIERF